MAARLSGEDIAEGCDTGSSEVPLAGCEPDQGFSSELVSQDCSQFSVGVIAGQFVSLCGPGSENVACTTSKPCEVRTTTFVHPGTGVDMVAWFCTSELFIGPRTIDSVTRPMEQRACEPVATP
jgi:hypothetical protein